MEREPQRNI
jgi:hypothetical protein